MGEDLAREVDEQGLFRQIRLDLGQVISVTHRPLYPNETWGRTYNNRLPQLSPREALVEYTAHPDAHFHLSGARTVPAARLRGKGKARALRVVPPARRRVTLRAVEKVTRRPVPVKLHVHGEAGEYLAPVDRHRIINPWIGVYQYFFWHGFHPCMLANVVRNIVLFSLQIWIVSLLSVDQKGGKLRQTTPRETNEEVC